MKTIGSVLFFSVLMFFSACNNMPNNSTVYDKQNVSDKPCSSEVVKNQVLSMYSNSFIKGRYASEDVVIVKLVKDSIDDIISTPVSNNTCKCEGTIYYYYQEKDTWSPEQKAQNWYK